MGAIIGFPSWMPWLRPWAAFGGCGSFTLPGGRGRPGPSGMSAPSGHTLPRGGHTLPPRGPRLRDRVGRPLRAEAAAGAGARPPVLCLQENRRTRGRVLERETEAGGAEAWLVPTAQGPLPRRARGPPQRLWPGRLLSPCHGRGKSGRVTPGSTAGAGEPVAWSAAASQVALPPVGHPGWARSGAGGAGANPCVWRWRLEPRLSGETAAAGCARVLLLARRCRGSAPGPPPPTRPP